MNEEKIINRQNEGRIHVDENGNRWIFRNGLYYAMCRYEPLEDEECQNDL